MSKFEEDKKLPWNRHHLIIYLVTLSSPPLCHPSSGEAMMTWETTTWTVVTSVMPSSVTPEPETTAPVLSMSLTCV